MKAWIWKGVNDLELDGHYPDPQAKPGWVVLKVLSAGVCSTDVAIVTGQLDAGRPPAVLGHEICGEVVDVGDGVTAIRKGERVVVETFMACGWCPKCRSGNKHLCREAGEIGFPPHNGGYAEYVAVPQGCVRRVPDVMTDDEGAILEASVCPFGRLYREGLVPGATVLVQGSGVAGLSFVQAAKICGARKVIVAARNAHRLAESRKFGADVTVNVKEEDLEARVMEETGGEGVDLSIDAAGGAPTIDAAVRCCAKGGKVMLYGIPSDDVRVRFPVKEMIFRQITVSGGTSNELAWVPLMELIAAGRFNIRDMVTHHFAFEDLPEAIRVVGEHPAGLIKAVLGFKSRKEEE